MYQIIRLTKNRSKLHVSVLEPIIITFVTSQSVISFPLGSFALWMIQSNGRMSNRSGNELLERHLIRFLCVLALHPVLFMCFSLRSCFNCLLSEHCQEMNISIFRQYFGIFSHLPSIDVWLFWWKFIDVCRNVNCLPRNRVIVLLRCIFFQPHIVESTDSLCFYSFSIRIISQHSIEMFAARIQTSTFNGFNFVKSVTCKNELKLK